MAQEDRLTAVLNDPVTSAGLVLDAVRVAQAGKRRLVRITVDLPEDQLGSLDLDAVCEVSRRISQTLDDSDALGGAPYVLEVSSPGVDRPLRELRHWKRARTRLVSVPIGARTVTGRVVEVTTGALTLDVDGTTQTHPWDAVGTGKIQVEFNRVDEDAESPDTDTVDGVDLEQTRAGEGQ